jgi:hypothetical protein
MCGTNRENEDLNLSSIQFQPSTKKFIGILNGKIITSSLDRKYVERKMKTLGFFDNTPAPAPKPSEFTINQRFEFVAQMVNMVSKGTAASVIITGQGGLGKTHTVLNSLEKAGVVNITDLAKFQEGQIIPKKSFVVIKGFSTAKGLYRSLFENNGKTIVFDDCDSILKDPIAINLLKGALDSYSKRYISWNADMKDDDLPRSFEFTGRIIFISNMSIERLDQAIITRALCVDLSMTEEQKIERMSVIVKSKDFLPEISEIAKTDALAFLKTMVGQAPNLSLRSLISVAKIASEGGTWKNLAKYVVTQGAV